MGRCWLLHLRNDRQDQQEAEADWVAAAQNFLFLSKKCKQLFSNRQKPGKIAWTLVYRRAHRKVEHQVASELSINTSSIS